MLFPLLLLLDGHSSHFEPQSIQFAKENGIFTFCLPPHTMHDCQPLDVGLFGPLKRHWQQECHKFYQKHPSLVISKLNFYLVFRQDWRNAVSPANICGGFKKAGVFPYNRNAMLMLEVAATIPVKNVKRMVLWVKIVIVKVKSLSFFCCCHLTSFHTHTLINFFNWWRSS